MFLKGSFLASRIDSFFGDGVEGLSCSRLLLTISVLVCWIVSILEKDSVTQEGS